MLALLIALTAGGFAGLVSLPHCVAMCGPYAGFACATGDARDDAPRGTLTTFLGARALGYGTLGAIAGASGGALTLWLPPRAVGVALGITLALGMSTLAWRLVREQPRTAPLVTLHRSAEVVAKSRRGALARASLLGGLVALFPCGSLYGALLLGAATASPWRGAATLVGFALTSSLALGLSGWLAGAASLLDRPTRRILAIALLVGAAVLVVRPLALDDAPEAGPACHGDGGES